MTKPPDRAEFTSVLARITAAVASNPRRKELRPTVEALLSLVGLDPADAEWLTGPSPRFRAPLIDAHGERAEKLRAALGSRETGVLHILGKFIWLEWTNAGDGLATTCALAARELRLSESSVRVRLSTSGGHGQVERRHPITGLPDIATFSRLAVQPLDKRAALAEAEARVAAIEAQSAAPKAKRRGAY